jgi:protein-disulfide isomerase
MSKRRWLEAIAIAAALGGPASVADAQTRKAAPAAKPAARDWTRVVSVTPEGGFRMGNPNAAVKVVEYGSLTCPGCAAFSASAKTPLPAQVRTGKVSFEFRNMVLNAIDLTASMLARCSGPANFFPFIDRLFATQPQWAGKIGAMTQAQREQLQALSPQQQLSRIAEVTGLTQMAAQAGLSPAKAGACLADKAGLDRIVQMRQAAQTLGVTGTPTFFINGASVHAHDWGELQAEIRKAGG